MEIRPSTTTKMPMVQNIKATVRKLVRRKSEKIFENVTNKASQNVSPLSSSIPQKIHPNRRKNNPKAMSMKAPVTVITRL
ncbi:hypothetical protein PH210_09385 [Paenibacillus sp. BSR1-1]|uniref:hypothetical protein n=1 Tax=Paenibacillus sp. BSR1-1 TaxID=3020845 RepID=UPI0025B2526C|nr:hypothetical protein [Paenibacillus sp. BSR1-1]MDN3016413.1 hypothetical protein [Paenibacillus sp. BSR1-1]